MFADGNRGEVRERIEPKGCLYGFGLGINQEIYAGYDYRVIPLPIIGYRGDNFRVLGPFVIEMSLLGISMKSHLKIGMH